MIDFWPALFIPSHNYCNNFGQYYHLVCFQFTDCHQLQDVIPPQDGKMCKDYYEKMFSCEGDRNQCIMKAKEICMSNKNSSSNCYGIMFDGPLSALRVTSIVFLFASYASKLRIHKFLYFLFSQGHVINGWSTYVLVGY